MPGDCSLPYGGRLDRRGSRNRCTDFGGRWALPRSVEREAIFHLEFRQDLRYWVGTGRKAVLRSFELFEAVLRDPLVGIGKPEASKYVLAGCWSHRITQSTAWFIA